MKKHIEKREKINRIQNLIQRILYNNEIGTDEHWWESSEAVNHIENIADAKDEIYICSSEDLKITTESPIVFVAIKKSQIDELQNKLLIFLQSIKRRNTVNLVFFIEDIETKITVKYVLENKNNAIYKALSAVERRQVIFIFDKNYTDKEIVINNANRFNMLMMPEIDSRINLETEVERAQSETGYLMTIDLKEMIEVYNAIGDTLFDKNVRYGIEESLGVDESIKETLEKEPEKFWFRNNGITIATEEEFFQLDRSSKIILKHANKPLEFHVVNGAQTITAASELYYSLKVVNDEKNIEKLQAMNKAKVVLRILHIPKKSGKSNAEMLNVSVALNRQKPIHIEDIAYMSAFTQQLVKFLKENEKGLGHKYFMLSRRGDEETKLTNRITMSLSDFARAKLACMGNPADARTKSAKTLLRVASDSEEVFCFTNTDIFVAAKDIKDLFLKHYGAISFAYQLSRLYEKQEKRVEQLIENEMSKVILQNGKWYFVAYVIGVLNDFSKDFTEFNQNVNAFKREIATIMRAFVDSVSKSDNIKEHYPKLNSNDFKKNNIFEDICNNEETRKRLEALLFIMR